MVEEVTRTLLVSVILVKSGYLKIPNTDKAALDAVDFPCDTSPCSIVADTILDCGINCFAMC